MKNFILFIVFFCATLGVKAQYNNFLEINDPKYWYKATPTIDEVSIIARPKGVYMEYNIYMSYSAVNTSLNKPTDTTEIVHFFTLPADALVTDSWLWVGNEIVKANMRDRWSASAVYEGIVKRRKDPSILTKNSPTNYEFRIFPLPGNAKRKVKLTILMPINFNGERATVEMPLNLFNLSNKKLSNIKLSVPKNTDWSDPKITQKTNLAFLPQNNVTLGDYNYLDLPYSNESSMNLSFNNPMKEGVYAVQYQQGKEKYYAMAIHPLRMYDYKQKGKKITFALAYNPYLNSNNTQYFEQLKANLLETMTAKDSINFVYNRLKTSLYAPKYIAATPNNIEKALAALQNYSDYTPNLTAVLAESIEFQAQRGGKIILISQDIELNTEAKSDNLLSVLQKNYPNLPQIDVLDFAYGGYTFYKNGKYFYGNQYFYEKLTLVTGGNSGLYYYSNADYNNYFKSFFQSIDDVVKNFDVFTYMQSGYCYARQNIGKFGNSGNLSVNQPLIHTGKFEGVFPINVQISGEYQNEFFVKSIAIPESLVQKLDSTVAQTWTGAYFSNTITAATSLQSSSIKNIIDLSIKKRVLSVYTAFLALEPGVLDTKTCKDCKDETGNVTAIADVLLDSIQIKVYPNPFRDNVTLEVTSDVKQDKSLKISILNIQGQLIEQSQIIFDTDNKATFTWEAPEQPRGVYLAQLTIGNKIKTVKLVKIE